MHTLINISSFVFCLLAVVPILGYQEGAPKQACTNMIPQHGVDPLPGPTYHVFKINKDIYTFQPGEKVPISLHVLNQNPQFKGFMIQARNDEDQIVGTFESQDPNVQATDCDAIEHNTITHVNGQKKTLINATWIAPNDETSVKTGVKFVYTVVEEKSRFWVKQMSPILEFKSGGNDVNKESAFTLIMLALLIGFMQT